MTNKYSRKSRRKLLKSVAVSSGVVMVGKSLQEGWVKPVVDAVLLPAHAETSTASPGSQTFNSSAKWVVPAGVSSINVEVNGAGGGDGIDDDGPSAGAGGAGGRSTGVIPVIAGETLSVIVGGAGIAATGIPGGAGGSGGGGNGGAGDGVDGRNGGGGGGGASWIEQSGSAIVVAGGGGGGGGSESDSKSYSGGVGGGTGTNGTGS